MNTRLFALLCLAAPLAQATTPIEDGSASNVWVLDGSGAVTATYRVGDATRTATLSGGTVAATAADGSVLAVPGTSAASEVLVNAVGGSYPVPAMAPPMSVVGLAAALNSATAVTSPTLRITPASGTYDTTTRVTIEAFLAPSGATGLTLYVSVNGGPETTVDGTVAHEVLVLSGEHLVSARAVQGGQETIASASYTLTGIAPRRRDTDGDGIPDFVEVAKGLDAFRDDLAEDADGDGWANWDEVLRGTASDDAADAPVDTDGDGWSDWDEGVRGTAADDATSVPRAVSLYAAETLLSGVTYDDAAATIATTDEGLVVVTAVTGRMLGSVTGGPRTSGTETPSDAALSAGDAFAILDDLMFDTSLASFGPARIAADGDAVVVARPSGGRHVRSRWLNGRPDLTPTEVAARLDAEGDWTTAGDYLDAYEAVLTTGWSDDTPPIWWTGGTFGLVAEETAVLHPESALGVGLVEAVLGWAAMSDTWTGGTSYSVTVPVRLGEASVMAGGPWIDAYPWDGHLADVAALGDQTTFDGGLDATLVREALFASPDDGESATEALARRLQQPTAGSDATTAAYQARLVAYVGRAAVDDFVPLSGEPSTDPWRPGDDADSDGLTNEAELAPGPFGATDPLYPDTDDDGRGDLADPCPLDATDACLLDDAFATDLDGDGVLDAVDNCFGLKNTTQLDANHDGIGDACEAAARIARPVGNVTAVEGAEVRLTTMVSAAAVGAVTFEWWINGANKGGGDTFVLTASSAEWGSSVVDVVLKAGTGGKVEDADRRTVTVLEADGPVPCLAIDCSDGDPCTDDACDLATGCYHTLVLECTPCATADECDDGDPCTANSCVGNTCVTSDLTGDVCDDGNACTTGEVCGAGGCGGGVAVVCDDADPCTIESCVPATGCKSIEDPTPDPVLCPECAVDSDCAAGTCTGGTCCLGTGSMDMALTWNPGDPALSVCLPADVEFTVVASSAVKGNYALKSPAGVTLKNVTNGTGMFGEVERTPLPGLYTLTATHAGTVTVTFHTTVDEEDVVPAFGTSFTTPVGSVGAEVYQRFTGTAGMRVSVLSGLLGVSCKTQNLLAPDGTVLWDEYHCATQAFSDLVVLPSDGVYTVFGDNNDVAVTGLKTTVWQVPAEPVVVTSLGAPKATMPLLTPAQNGAFEFVGSVGDRIFSVVDVFGCQRLVLRAPSGTAVSTISLVCGDHFNGPVTLAETGTYRWEINPTDTNTGTAGLTTWLLPPDPVVAGAIDGGNTPVTVTHPGQIAEVTFSATAGERITVTVGVGSGLGCGTPTLLAPSGATVAGGSLSCSSTIYFDAMTLTETGVYRVRLNANDAGTGTYTVNVRSVPADVVVAAVIGGGVVPVANTVVGQNMQVTFDGTAGQNLVFTGAAGTKTVAYTLADPTGTTVHSASKLGTYTSPTLVLPVTGTYTLRLNPSSNTVLTVNVTLTSPP